jgi:hypothetical protein
VIQSSVTLEEFLGVLEKYRDQFYWGHPPEEQYYIEVFQEINDVSIRGKIRYINSILLFLNRWKCRFSRQSASGAISKWIDREANALERLSALSIDAYNESVNIEIDRLYKSLMELKKEGIHNMSDACASKILHLMVPKLFVMWDKDIMQFRGARYSSFLADMQQFAMRLKVAFTKRFHDEDIETYLQRYLKYSVRKPLTKYIDEYNWYVVSGHRRIQY